MFRAGRLRRIRVGQQEIVFVVFAVLFVVFSVFLPGWRSDVMGHSRLRWSRPKLIHVRFNSECVAKLGCFLRLYQI